MAHNRVLIIAPFGIEIVEARIDNPNYHALIIAPFGIEIPSQTSMAMQQLFTHNRTFWN